MDDHHRQDVRRDHLLALAIKAVADLVPDTSGHSRLTLEDALATMQEERARIVRRWD